MKPLLNQRDTIMTTKKDFYEPGCLEEQVRVVACTKNSDGLYETILDRTPFHPKGGGQPADRGTLGGIPVEAVYQNEAGDIVHCLKEALTVGKEAEAKVDAEARRLHSRLHSAGHLISRFVETQGWKALKGDHFPGECRVVFRPADPSAVPPLPEAQAIEAWLKEVAAEKLPFSQEIDEKGFRTVTWGSLEPYPCGGTHVADTSEIGAVRVKKIRLKKGELTVSYETA
jgi:alanyl-tRNA synthetase